MTRPSKTSMLLFLSFICIFQNVLDSVKLCHLYLAPMMISGQSNKLILYVFHYQTPCTLSNAYICQSKDHSRDRSFSSSSEMLKFLFPLLLVNNLSLLSWHPDIFHPFIFTFLPIAARVKAKFLFQIMYIPSLKWQCYKVKWQVVLKLSSFYYFLP